MTIKKLLLALCLTLCLLIAVGGLLVFLYPAGLVHRELTPQQPTAQKGTVPPPAAQPVFNPPALEAAPADIREAVLLGYQIMMNTQKYAKGYVGNTLSCRNCHFDGGRRRDTLSLVGVAAKYPLYRDRREYATDLALRTQGCFERSMNGTAPAANSQIIQSLLAYYAWISKGVPIYAELPWLGLRGPALKDYKPDTTQGEAVFKATCARCHGGDGLGTPIAPPLWGDQSFNDGAGMNKLKNFSEFSLRYMPKNSPSLTPKQAMDVAGYALAQPRPHFVATHPNKIERVISLPMGE